ncbi:MAG: hypothetical protein ACFE89_10300 [Candidatus Hodarchaeota archaeon]
MNPSETTTTADNSAFFKDSLAATLPPNAIRVAIYDEPNTTAPSYTTVPGTINNNATQLAAMLNGYGFQTTLLDVHDIYDNALMTAHFDVLALVDNFPRENITNKVEDFWLAGGSLLVFDGAAEYLCYRGILPPETAGGSGNGVYWFYGSKDFTVFTRHPVSKSYALSDNIDADDLYNYFYWDWPTMSGSSIGSYITRVAQTDDDPDGCSVLAFDPEDRGGKIVTFAYDFAHEALPSVHPMIRDAIQWLCPQPKARIAFDLTHEIYYGIDSWDWDQYPTSDYEDWRNDLVSRGYLVDKLQPSTTGNLTETRLAPYDTLVVVAPGEDITAAERTAVTNWVTEGGSLLAMGDLIAINPQNQRINFLLANFDLHLNNSNNAPGVPGTASGITLHPTREGASDYFLTNGGLVNYSGNAQPLWGIDAGNIIIAADEHGTGRVVLTSDLNGFSNADIGSSSNERIAINVINWLSSAKARVLVLSNWPVTAPHIYRSPLALALNNLGIKYYLTGLGVPSIYYLNLSLHLYSWDLVIYNNPGYSMASAYLDELLDYVDAGGYLIMSYFFADGNPTHPFWAKLGMEYNSTYSGEPPMYIWDSSHHIFNQPMPYGDTEFQALPGTSDDGDSFKVFSNATALAGLTSSDTPGNATIILRNDGRTLYNGYLIDCFYGDYDDSTYADNFELWMNEIAFIMAPRCVFTPNVPVSHVQGFPLTFSVDIINNGLTPAVGGNLTVTIPAALGILSESATQPFVLDPGASTTITWHSTATGVANHTITFDGTYHGLPTTTYTSGTLTRYLNITPGLPFALPWWWWIAAIAVIVIVVVIILVLCLRRRSGSK